MKKRWAILSVIIFGAILIFYHFGVFDSKRKDPSSLKKASSSIFYIPFQITEWSGGCPCLPGQIGNQTFLAGLDLGFRGDFSMVAKILDTLEEKSYLGTKKMYGFRNTTYEKNLYEVPAIRIGDLTFYRPVVQEEAVDFHKDSSVLKEGDSYSPAPDEARIGWVIFHKANLLLLLDLGNNMVAFCDSLNTITDKGFVIENYAKVPLLTERGLLEFNAATPQGSLRFALDTGCSWNIINCEVPKDQTIDQFALDEKNIHEISDFTIDGVNFGSQIFRKIPIQIPIHVDAILGMEFLKKHQIILDFAGDCVYFSKKSNDDDCNVTSSHEATFLGIEN